MNKKTNPLSSLRSLSALVALLTVSTLVACGGGGDSAGAITGGGGGGTAILAGDFAASNPSPGANTASMISSGTSTIAFDKESLLRGQPPQPIGGIAFDGGTLIAN